MSESRDSRERILDAAERLFADKGYAGTSVREIVAAAKITNPMLYYYFGSKEELLRKLLSERFTMFFESLTEPMNSATTTRELLCAFANGMVNQAIARPSATRLIMSFIIVHHKDVPRALLFNQSGTMRDALMARIKELDDSLNPDRIEFVAILLHQTLVGLLLGIVADAYESVPEDYATCIAERFDFMLRDEHAISGPIKHTDLVCPMGVDSPSDPD